MAFRRTSGAWAAASLLLLLGAAGCAQDAQAPSTTSPATASPSVTVPPSSSSGSGTPSSSGSGGATTSSAPASSTPATTPTHSPTSTTRPPSPAPTTAVRLDIVGNGCDDCAFEAFITVAGTVRSLGRQGWLQDWPLVWRMPTAATSTLVLRFTDLTDDTVQGRPTVVVMRYDGVPAGARLTVAEAQAQSSAQMCWAGTRSSTATITAAVELVDDPGTSSPGASPSADGTQLRLVYSLPMAGGSGAFRPTYLGALGVSGTLACP